VGHDTVPVGNREGGLPRAHVVPRRSHTLSALSGPRHHCPSRTVASPRARSSRPHHRPCPKPTDAVRARHHHRTLFFHGTLSLAPSPSSPSQGHRWPLEPSPHRRTPPPIRFFSPPRRQGTPVSYRLHPHARRVASPPWVLERRRLLHLRRCSAAAGRAATRTRRAVTAPARCAHGPSRRCERGPRALCNWAKRSFGPVAVGLVFHFPNIFKFLQI
jgi:hypothetical protein